ncbi:ABC-type Fe3+-siderophore transport system permease subunit [Actinokineospora baliensis]|nr:ABC-type Fe3+-siderophore transport system permease subunit [Actinokineospora baliensis]
MPMSALTSLAPWSVVLVLALICGAVVTLVVVALGRRQPGDEIEIRLFLAKIKITSAERQKLGPGATADVAEIATEAVTSSGQPPGG